MQSVDDKDNFILVSMVDSAQGRYEVVIDPTQGFTMHRFTHWAHQKGGLIKIYEMETKETRIVSGTWIPWHITGETQSVSQTLGSRFDILVTDCKLGGVVEADLAFDFRPGTLVIDDTKQEAYTIQKDGSHKSAPLLNPKTGKITGGQPSTAPATQPLGKD